MKLQVCIVDDHLAARPPTVDESVLIRSADLRLLLDSNALWWANEINLKGLLQDLLDSDAFKHGQFELTWAMNPVICLNAVTDGYRPDLIVFDWKYGTLPYGHSTVALLEQLVEKTTSEFFIFSTEPDPIPGEIVRRGIDSATPRIRVLEKGESLIVMTADEMISNWVVSHSGNPMITLLGKKLSFRNSPNLTDPLDLLYLRDLLERTDIERWWEALTDTMGSREVASVLGLIDRRIVDAGKYLISPEEVSLLEEHEPGVELDYAQAFEKYGLRCLWLANSVGIAHT